MDQHSKTASLAGLTDSVVMKTVAASSPTYQIRPEIATSDYAAKKIARRFRLTVSTAREVCRLAGLAVHS